jgi:hypothetical protein
MIAAGSGIPSLRGTCGTGLGRRWAAASPALVVLSCLLVQGCGNSENKVAEPDPAVDRPEPGKGDILAPSGARRGAEMRPPTAGDSFADRFSFADRHPKDSVAGRSPRDSFADRYPRDSFSDRYSAALAFAAHPGRETARDRTGTIPGSYKVAALSPSLSRDVPYALPAIKPPHTKLIGFDNSAFPGKNAGNGSSGGRYSDNRVLVHVPAGFDARKPGVIVVFFHGHRATLERDVRDRQLLPAQISESGANAVLVAPQLAYDAPDSNPGRFAERDGLKRFMAEAAGHLARVYGDPRAEQAFANMPVVIVAYSGGFLPAAWSLHLGGLSKRVTGVVLLDALYGELEKFSSWIAKNRHAFFVSAYTQHLKRRDDELARILRDKGIPVQHELDGPLKPGTVAFLATGQGIRHHDYVTLAWTEHPVKDVLQRMAQR